MARRRRLSRGKSRKIFRKGLKSNRRNRPRLSMRGGIRM